MNTNNFTGATESVINTAMQLITALSDPDAVKARLAQLAAATATLTQAQSVHDDARAQAEAAVAKLAGLEADKAELATKQAEHNRNVLALNVAADANSQRAKALDEKGRAVDAQARDLQKRTAAFDQRVRQFREQLTG